MDAPSFLLFVFPFPCGPRQVSSLLIRNVFVPRCNASSAPALSRLASALSSPIFPKTIVVQPLLQNHDPFFKQITQLPDIGAVAKL